MADFFDIEQVTIDFDRSIRKAKHDLRNLACENNQLKKLWWIKIQGEEKAAEGCFENVHQKIQEDMAARSKLEKEIKNRQRELDAKSEECAQIRKTMKQSKKCLETKESQLDALRNKIESANEGIATTDEEVQRALEKRNSLLQLYEERLGLAFKCDGSSVTIVFTRLVPDAPRRSCKVTLRKQRSRFAATADPSIKIPKAALNGLDSNEGWARFLIYCRNEFRKSE